MKLIGKILEKLRGKKSIEELEMDLLEAHVHPDVIDLLKKAEDPISFIKERLRAAPLEGRIIMLVGINGSGKTTTAVKLAHYFINKGYRTAIAASDTFRAGSIEQLEEWNKRVPFILFKKGYGADPASVAYEAVHSDAEKIIIDTAGRQDTRKDLIEELKKIKRVSGADKTIMVVDATQGVSVLEQVKQFQEHVPIDGFIVAKYDIDSKGGVPLTVGVYTGLPIFFVGIGQNPDGLEPFDPDKYVKELI